MRLKFSVIRLIAQWDDIHFDTSLYWNLELTWLGFLAGLGAPRY